LFHSNTEYDAYVAAMVASGALQDTSHLWWAIRPSLKYPTLELRAPDCCTRIDDTIAIATLYRCLVRFLYANSSHNAGLDVVDRAIAVENKWRAQRYGAQGTFVTRFGRISVGELLNMVLELIASDAEALDCSDQVEHCRTIVSTGTSADAQLQIFTENRHEGAAIALHKVSRWIKDATLATRLRPVSRGNSGA
jgi:carboxylate-amine ligase